VLRLFTCSTCGRITDQRHCPDHPARDSVAQQRFRVAVLKRDGHRCRLCGSTDDLRAAHWPIPLRALTVTDDPYHPRRGLTVCGECDRRTDPYARR
jgi:RNA polymerase subunit RPABC4/transcription elongation factor Spt4